MAGTDSAPKFGRDNLEIFGSRAERERRFKFCQDVKD